MYKKYIRWFAPLLILFSFFQELEATITSAEYYYNSADNGAGFNNSLALVVTDGIATATGSNLSTVGLSAGIHVIYSRLYDDVYGWGPAQGLPFFIENTTPVTEHPITAAEYFYDSNDGGAGSNPTLSVVVNDGIATATGLDLSTSGLAAGIHTIYSRFYADNHGWGPPQGMPFFIANTTPVTEHPITAAEYFFDSNDAGAGSNPTLSVITNNGVTSAIGTSLATDGLFTGIHTIYSRFYADNHGWGPAQGMPFFITDNTTPTEHPITAAEYFINTDPGHGQGAELSVSVTADVATATGTNLATDGLSAGLHTIYSRFYAENHGWGPAQGMPFFITSTEIEYNITSAECFIDTDPGLGQGTALGISITDGIATATGTDIPTDSLVSGLHVIYSRMQAENYGWGPARGIPFVVLNPVIDYTISTAEYFIDDDPGPGLGTSLNITGADSQVSLNEEVTLSNETEGLHSLSVRFFSPEFGWGPPRSTLFQVGEGPAVSFIQSAQYFIGDSPELSEIITVTSPTDGSFDELNEALNLVDIEIPEIGLGLRTVGVRFQRSDGFWSPWRTTNFIVVLDGPTHTISAAEYFIDVDPGEGAGTSIENPEDGAYDEVEEEFNFPVSVEGLPEGGHVAYLRLQRSDGSWGAPRGSYFIVSQNAQPTIAAAEYYVNPATPEGGGISFNPLDGAFNTIEESVTAIANMASLNAQEVGNYTLFVRFQNSRGEWGPIESQNFNVQTRPQISTSSDTLEFGGLFTGESRVLSLSVSNIGDETLEVTGLNFSDPAYSTDWTGGSIAPLNEESFDITFAPVDPEGSHNAILIIANNDVDKEITLLGNGLETAPIMAVTPDTLNFGTVQTIANATLSIRVSNSGNEDLVLTGASSTNVAFTASIPNPTVVPEEFVDVDITFAPSLGQAYVDTLYLLSNDTYFPSYPIFVRGVGSVVPVPDIHVSVESLDFGNIALDDAPVNLGLVINNTGTASLNILSVSIDEPAFTTSLSTGQVIAASNSLPVTVSFTPTESRRYTGTMILGNDDPDSPEIPVSLSGSSVFPNMVLIPGTTFNFGDVGVTTSSAQSLIISNIGTDTLKISSFEKSANLDTILTISPGSFNLNPLTGQRNFTLTFQPAEPIFYQGTVIIHSNTDPDTLYINGTGIDDEAPAIVFDPTSFENTGTSENSPIHISAVISDNNQVSWVRLYYRQGGKAVYDSTAMNPQAGVYQGTIPQAYVRNRGVEYYIKAFDGANAQVIPATAPEVPAIVRVRLPALPSFTFTAETYGMISVPSDLDQKNVLTNLESDIGEYDVHAWRLFRWINGSYVELSDNENFTFEPGNAYWLITSERQVINLDSSTSVKTNEDYLISLDQGWNQVGTPYYFPVSWSDVYAASPGVVQGSIAYEWVENEWQPASTMQPFGGYFISTSSGGSILRFPPREAVSVTSKITGAPMALEESEWVIKVSAENGVERDRFNYVGVLLDAEMELDINDQPKPPPMYADQLTLSSPHEDWGSQSGSYSGDFQGPTEAGNFWDLTLRTGSRNEDVLLNLEQFGPLPENYAIRVLNLDLRYELPTTDEGVYRQIQFSPEATYQLRVLVGDDGFMAEHDEGITQAPESYRLSQNYPNPFNGETRIQYDIPEPTALRIVVYDLKGRVVTEILNTPAHAVGYHQIIWNGLDDSGQVVASGLYLISLQSPEFQASRKMVLLK